MCIRDRSFTGPGLYQLAPQSPQYAVTLYTYYIVQQVLTIESFTGAGLYQLAPQSPQYAVTLYIILYYKFLQLSHSQALAYTN